MLCRCTQRMLELNALSRPKALVSSAVLNIPSLEFRPRNARALFNGEHFSGCAPSREGVRPVTEECVRDGLKVERSKVRFAKELKRSILMKRILSLAIAMVFAGLPAYAQKDENKRIRNAGKVMVEILNIPDDIPQDVIEKAECVIEGGSFGLQLGGQATDFVLLVMNRRGADSILTNQVKLGGDVTAAAGPKGRSAAAATDVSMRAEILSYSRARIVRRDFARGFNSPPR
jgi:hypothetical protein